MGLTRFFGTAWIVAALVACGGCGMSERPDDEVISLSKSEAAARVNARLGELAEDRQFRNWRELPNLTAEQLTVGEPLPLYDFRSGAKGEQLWKELKNRPEGYIVPVMLDDTPVATAGLDWADERGYFYYVRGEFAPGLDLTPEYTALVRVTDVVRKVVGESSAIKCISGGLVVPGCAVARMPGGSLVVSPYGTSPSIGDVSDSVDLAAWEEALGRFEDYRVYVGGEAIEFLRTAYFWN